MKIVFLGTPKFGADVLDILAKSKHQIVGVVCQPDRIGNRKKIEACAVKKLAERLDLTIFQFEKVSRDGVEQLKSLGADVFVTAAYGQILSQEVLDIAKYGVFNVHGSLLPKYRGAAPVQFALIEGEKQTGVTIMKTALSMDSGDIASQVVVDIQEEDNSQTILDKLAQCGANALLEVLDKIENNSLVLTPQDEQKATFCSKITTEMSKIDWNKSNVEIFNLIRGLNPNPVAFTTLDGVNFKIYDSRPVDCECDAQNGQVVECAKSSLTIKCGKGGLKLLTVQLSGGKMLGYKDFINGRKIKAGDVLGQ